MRRLFSTFAPGLPGAGLLIMRLVAATAVIVRGLAGLSGELSAGVVAYLLLTAALGLLLAAGLWTPVAGALVAILEFVSLFRNPSDPWIPILVATLGTALALLGPGAWSVDARLFGWKRIEVGDRRNGASPPRPDRRS